MEAILSALLSGGIAMAAPAVLFFGLFAFGFSPYHQLWSPENTPDRKRVIGTLIQLRPRDRRRSALTRRLDRLDARLSRHEAGRGPWRVAFSWDLLGLTMFCAVGYPLAAALLQWLAGQTIVCSTTELVPAGTWGARLFFVGVLTLAGGLYGVAFRLPPWRRGWLVIAVVMGVNQSASIAKLMGLGIPAALADAVPVASASLGSGHIDFQSQ